MQYFSTVTPLNNGKKNYKKPTLKRNGSVAKLTGGPLKLGSATDGFGTFQ
jgi:hypothetical protein